MSDPGQRYALPPEIDKFVDEVVLRGSFGGNPTK